LPPIAPQGFYPWPVWTSEIPQVAPSSTGLTYYVDGTNGDDANNGTSLASAVKTIAKALTLIAPGDTVLIRKGLYREGISLINGPSGTADKPITFGSYGDGEVILDGSTKVGPWEKVTGTVWQVRKTFNPVAVVVNEVPLKQVTQGQNGSTAPQVGLAGVTSGSGKWHNGTEFITADMGTVDPNSADIVVPNDDSDQNHVYFYQKEYLRFKGLTVRGSGSNGIWGYGSHITIEDCNIKFNGKAGISFQPNSEAGVESTDNAVLTSHIYHNVLINWPRGNNGFAESGGGWPGGLGWSGNLRPLARGNIVHMNGGEGIISFGTAAGKQSGSAIFEQNVVYDNWSVNMYFDNQPNNVARNNLIYNHPIDFNPATTNLLYVSDSLFPYNQLGKYSVGLMLADEQNSSDATNGYANLANTQVYNNIIAGTRVGIRDYGEGADASRNHGLKNTLIANNTIIMPVNAIPNTAIFGIFLQDNTEPSGTNRNTGTVIANNLIVGFNNDPVIFSQKTGALDGITLNNNLYFSSATRPFGSGFNDVQSYDLSAWKVNTGSETNSQFLEPLLENLEHFRLAAPELYNYKNAKLKSTSPALNAGAEQSFTPKVNFELEPRTTWNIGAF
jgi:hypothetical protein